MTPSSAPPRPRPYVLFVATVESRKNHLMVFNAWLALIRRHGAEAVPDLVCVGKRGWKAADERGAGLPRRLRRLLHRAVHLQPHPRHASRQTGRRALRATGRARPLPDF